MGEVSLRRAMRRPSGIGAKAEQYGGARASIGARSPLVKRLRWSAEARLQQQKAQPVRLGFSQRIEFELWGNELSGVVAVRYACDCSGLRLFRGKRSGLGRAQGARVGIEAEPGDRIAQKIRGVDISAQCRIDHDRDGLSVGRVNG